MLLKDVHNDLERYLREDCYCPGEIYDTSGFFYQIFKPEDECFVLGEAKGAHNLYWADGYTGLYVVCKEQILELTIHGEKVIDSCRMDATDNNLRIFKEVIQVGKPRDDARLDCFEKNHTKRDLDMILQMSDAILVD